MERLLSPCDFLRLPAESSVLAEPLLMYKKIVQIRKKKVFLLYGKITKMCKNNSSSSRRGQYLSLVTKVSYSTFHWLSYRLFINITSISNIGHSHAYQKSISGLKAKPWLFLTLHIPVWHLYLSLQGPVAPVEERAEAERYTWDCGSHGSVLLGQPFKKEHTIQL